MACNNVVSHISCSRRTPAGFPRKFLLMFHRFCDGNLSDTFIFFHVKCVCCFDPQIRPRKEGFTEPAEHRAQAQLLLLVSIIKMICAPLSVWLAPRPSSAPVQTVWRDTSCCVPKILVMWLRQSRRGVWGQCAWGGGEWQCWSCWCEHDCPPPPTQLPPWLCKVSTQPPRPPLSCTAQAQPQCKHSRMKSTELNNKPS